MLSHALSGLAKVCVLWQRLSCGIHKSPLRFTKVLLERSSDNNAAAKAKPSQKAKTSGGSKAGRKKWSKGKSREKLNNAVLLDKETFNKINKELATQKVITIANVADKYKCVGSLARRIIRDFAAKGLIKKVIYGHRSGVFTKIA
eukprot:gene20010-23977_t